MKPIHFVYPTAEPVQGTYRFLGCGRYTVSEDAPGAGYQLVTTKHIRDIEELNDTASELVPDVFDTTQSVYEIRDDPTQQYQGYSKSLAYVLARISCARELKWEHGDLWCTGVVKLEGTHPYLKAVNDPEFTEKLNGFLDPANTDTLFIVPASNVTSEHESLCEEKHARSVLLRNAQHLTFQDITSQKTVLLVGRSELEPLVNFFFHTPKPADMEQQEVGFPSWEGLGVGSSGSDIHKRPLAYSTRPTVGFFVDREELLAQLQTDLRDPQKVLLVIDGLAGIGKTTVAAKLAEEMENEFRGIYWTKCSPETDLDQLLAELAYFLSEHGDQTFANVFAYNIPKENKLNFLISSLSNLTGLGDLSGLKFLLIFDDVHELLDEQDAIKNDDLRLLFTKLLTQSHASKILLISRAHPQFYRLSGSQSKNTVASIRQQAGIALLRQLGVDEDDELLEQAYKLTAGHPLAMELLAKLAGVMSLEDILANTQLFWGDETVIEQLLQEFNVRLSDDEQALLSTLSLLPRPATREMILFLTDNPNITPILTSLTKKVLLSFDWTQKVYKQHDLVRDFYRLKLDDQTKREIHLKAAEYYEQFKKEQENKLTFQEVEQRLSGRYHYFQAGEYEKAAQVLVEVSEYLREWGYFERCRMLLEETLKAIEGLGLTRERQLLIIDLLVELSWVESVFESFDKALERCERAENILKTIDDQRRAELVYRAMGRFLFEKADWENAEAYLTRSFEIGKQQGDTKGIVEALNVLTELYWESGELEKIETICHEGLEICKQYNDRKGQARILSDILGRWLLSQHRVDEVITVCEESLNVREADDFIGKALSLWRMGIAFRYKKDYEEALRKFDEGLSFAERAGDLVFQMDILRSKGYAYREQGKTKEIIEIYGAFEKLISQVDNLSTKAQALFKLGLFYVNTGELDEGLKSYQQCLQISRELGDIISIADTLHVMGVLYSSRYSDLDNAFKCIKESIRIREEFGRILRIGPEMNNLAFVYIEKGQFNEALKMFEKLFMHEKERVWIRTRTLYLLGSIYCAKEEFQKALEFLKESLQLYEKRKSLHDKSMALNYIGEVYIAFGNYEEALVVLEESVRSQVYYPNYKAHPLTNSADVYYHQGKLTEAMATCEESLALSRQYGGRIQAGKTLHLMAKIRMKEQHYDEALQYVREAADIFRDTGSRHLPEAEATLEELQNKKT